MLADHIPRLTVAGGIVRVLLQHGASDQRAHIQLIELLQPAAAFCLHRRAHRIEVTLLPQPEAEACLRHLLGHANRLEQDRQHGFAHGVLGAGGHGAAGDHQRFATSGGEGIELAELGLHPIGELQHQISGALAWKHLGVSPHVAERLLQVRLAAAKEPRHPGSVLAGLSLLGQVALQDPLHRLAVLAVAYEGAQLTLQLDAGVFVVERGDPRLAVVGQRAGARVALQGLENLLGHATAPVGWRVMPTAM